ncbi:AAA family ATPase [Microbacterium oxydans]|uniref:AAA family ATPase n=1 Tax=Microbacterium oxydans TaxID=82380 RepID=UPI00226B5E3B|nr:hypothetical protein [Microbacterium oxydans]WAA67667.1 AAA family ATPase [Microbacterium oxydans]
MDLLRLAGAPGVGKSTTAWAAARRIAADGVASGYIDTDQLGICYPAPDDDADRWALKERALAALAHDFRRAGVDRLVVSGVAWPDDPPPLIDGVSVRSLWLDASEATRRRRLAVRGSSEEQLAQMLSAGTAEAARVNPEWERLGTDGLSASQTVDEVLARWRPSPPIPLSPSSPPGAPRAEAVPGGARHAGTADRVLWITGPRLAGVSRIGWEIVTREWSAGRRTGFIDLAQLSFVWNVDGPAPLANLVGLHAAFREVGADLFVIVAPLDVGPEAVRAALPDSEVSFVRVVPSAADVRRHALFRQRGDGPALAGDDVVGAPAAAVDTILQTSDAQSSLPLREHEVPVVTGGLSPGEAAAAVRRSAEWPSDLRQL